jgi:hypothetical protein
MGCSKQIVRDEERVSQDYFYEDSYWCMKESERESAMGANPGKRRGELPSGINQNLYDECMSARGYRGASARLGSPGMADWNRGYEDGRRDGDRGMAPRFVDWKSPEYQRGYTLGYRVRHRYLEQEELTPP